MNNLVLQLTEFQAGALMFVTFYVLVLLTIQELRR